MQTVRKASRLTVQDLGMLFMTLTVEDALLLSLSLSDGLFSRIGTDVLRSAPPKVCCGTVTPELFQRVWSEVTTDVLRWKGRHSMPLQRGKRCELFMAMLFKGGQEWTTQWHYGSASDGPPPEIVSFMKRAIELTEQMPARRRETEGGQVPARDDSAGPKSRAAPEAA